MASTTETGHAKNVANFEDLILFCTGYGTAYNPSKNSIKLASLNTLLTDVRATLTDVTQKVTKFNIATNNRQDIFKNLKPLSTRIVNALSATDALDKTIDDAKAFNKKIQGTATKKKTTTPPDPTNATLPDAKTISTSQQSYDQLKEHFSKLISLLASESSYMPNETDLQTVTLDALLASMQAANTDVSNSYVDISNSRIERNKMLYAENTGLYDIAMEVKKYVKSIYGATSPQYKQISGIKFTKTIK